MRLSVSRARELRLCVFSKPGFPGVVVFSGDDVACEALVATLRSMRWQAMDVRWEQAGASPVATGLPSPFVELGENGMGEAASHCEAARLLPTFKTAVLKLAPADKTTEPAVEGAVQLTHDELMTQLRESAARDKRPTHAPRSSSGGRAAGG